MRLLRFALPLSLAALLLASSCPTSDKPRMVQSVIVEPNPFTVAVGQTVTLSDTLKDAAGNVLTGPTVAWSSVDTNIVKVSATGVVTGVADGGPLELTATSEGRTGSTIVTVTSYKAPQVQSVIVEPNPFTV